MVAKTGMTRREILTGAAGAAAAASLTGMAGCFPSVGGNWPEAGPDVSNSCGCSSDAGASQEQTGSSGPIPGRATVVTIQRSDSVDTGGKSTGQAQLDAVQTMIDSLLSTLAGGVGNPWPVLLPNVTKCTRIGLKVNCLNSYFPTTPAIIRAIISSLKRHVFDDCASNIIVWDRQLKEIQQTGKYSPDDLQGAQLLGTLGSPNAGYSSNDYGTLQGTKPQVSRILTELTDVTINCPVLKVHGQSGVTGALKNVFGIIDCPGSFHTSPSKGQDMQTALPAIYNLPPIRNGIKLTIIDALRAVTNGDTASIPNATPGRIFASTDPLAIDYYALDLINSLRSTPPLRMGPVNTNLDWMDLAHQLGLGTKGYNLVTLQPNGERADADGGAQGPDGERPPLDAANSID